MKELTAKSQALKLCFVAAISLLLLIPLIWVVSIICERENTKKSVTEEVASSYARSQTLESPVLHSLSTAPMQDTTLVPSILDYKAKVNTEVLRRSIYEIIVYTSDIEISGKISITPEVLQASKNTLQLDIKDFKGLAKRPYVKFGEKEFAFEKIKNKLLAQVELPKEAKAGDEIDFSIKLTLKGTESLMFYPAGEQTTLSISSPYPHPSFQGSFLPQSREVSDDGFNATWSVLKMNADSRYEQMGVKFVEPANPYQQAMRSAKYGLLIIILVFVAGLFVEFLTRKEISLIQYGVIGLSLVLFYALLLSFSEFIAFGTAYFISASMTIASLILYFRAILRNRSAYVLGGFIAAVYATNYMLLQMETYALLTGSLILFAMLSVVMYLTANTNTVQKLQQN